jgi:hypothetical protein
VIFPLLHVRRITGELAVGKQIPSPFDYARVRNDKQKASAEVRTTATATAEADSSATLRIDDKGSGRLHFG